MGGVYIIRVGQSLSSTRDANNPRTSAQEPPRRSSPFPLTRLCVDIGNRPPQIIRYACKKPRKTRATLDLRNTIDATDL